MVDNIFTPSPWIWAGLVGGLAALPVLIHLINMMRHRRVRWAAMEFLLKSHKKNRTWVWLKQLLLLAARMAALLLALFMLAQVGCQDNHLASLFDSKPEHHYVLLDDSYSMGDSAGGESLFDRARSTLGLIAARAKNRQNQRFTLLRFSRASITSETGADAEQPITAQADLNARPVDRAFDQRLEQVQGELSVSNLAVGPGDGLRLIGRLVEQRRSENAVVYVVSDFRARDWENQPEIARELSLLRARGADIQLIKCQDSASGNLAVTRLQPASNIRVAGVPLMMEVTVHNFGSTPARNVQLQVATQAFPESADGTSAPLENDPPANPLPALLIDQIDAGESQQRRFPVFFQQPGQHVVSVQLPDDAVGADNHWFQATTFAPQVRVLLIDGAAQENASYVALAISPQGMTGIGPEVQTRDYLRDVSPQVLDEFDVIYLLDVDRLDDSATKRLEEFVSNGGGLAVFLGPQANLAFYNSSLHASGTGLLPIPLERVAALPELVDDRVPDITPQEHAVFQHVLGIKNSPLDLVQVAQVVRPPAGWKQQLSRPVSVLASVRGDEDQPLIVEAPFGRGRVAVVMTTAAPIWNNWSRNATYPPTLLLLQDWLASGKYPQHHRTVGANWEFHNPAESYRPQLVFRVPAAAIERDSLEMLRTDIEKTALPASQNNDQLSVSIGPWSGGQFVEETSIPGVYDARWQTLEGKQRVQRFGLNVDTDESQMGLANPEALSVSLSDAHPTIVAWDQFSPDVTRQRSSALTQVLLLILIVVLLGEQVLAYVTSYHPRSRTAGLTC